MSDPLLASAIAGILPDARRTTLLQASLWTGDEGIDAFIRWQAGTSNPRQDIAGSLARGRLLAPLLYRAMQPSAGLVNPELLTQLRVASEREAQRSRAYATIVAETFGRLAERGLAPVALKGAALVPTVYPAPELRHSHDVDLLLPLPELPAAAATLEAAGFTLPPRSRPFLGTHRVWLHSSGLPLVLHGWAFIAPQWNRAVNPAERAHAVSADGVTLRVPALADQLIHVCVQAAAGPHRASLVWACDAYFLLTRGGAMDWPRVLAAAERGVAVQLYVTLRYLREALRAPVPEDALTALGTMADKADDFACEIALQGALPGRRALWRRARPGRERRLVLRWLFVPTRAFLAWHEGPRAAALVPLSYGWRMGRFVLRRMTHVLRRA